MPDFQTHLTSWYNQNKRNFPWRSTKNPYFIWLSEVILQQTRALQGLPYYQKFIDQFPEISDLANANIDDILKTWQGLGYYSRARNLHQTAIYINTELNGIFPSSYQEIIKLKGIGPYTAAAIASFAFNEKKAVVDGNVYRVLSRYYNSDTPIDTAIGKNHFQLLADNLIPDKNPDIFNQAIMELGATVCTPKQAKCNECPLQMDCQSYFHNTIYSLPVKSKKIKVTNRYLTYFIFKSDERFILQQRKDKDIWQGLYEFPLIDKRTPILQEEIEKYLQKREIKTYERISEPIKHILSHQHLHVQFIHIDKHPKLVGNEQTVKHFEDHALPRVIDKYLEQLT